MGCKAGEVWNPEIIADRIRRGLDVLGNVEGSILYRGPVYWEVLLPGAEGQVLLVGESGLPEWGSDAATTYKLWTDDFALATADFIRNYGHMYGVGTALVQTVAGSLQFSGQGGGGTNYSAWVPLKLAGAVAAPQFVEVVYTAVTGAARAFIGVCMTSDQRLFASGTNNGYSLLWIPESSQLRLEKITNGALGTSSPFGTMTIPAVGSVVALTAEWTGTGSVTLKVWDDGVVIKTAVDSGGPIHTGLPGFGSRDFPISTSLKFDNLRCGVFSEF